MNLKNKTVILGITGSIAAYKMANVASTLSKWNCDVHVIMTQNATEIITPMTFSTLTGNNCIVDTFDKTINYNVAHIALAKKADLLMIAPATANIIAKLAHGQADDMLTTTTLACQCKKIIAPAMNTAMFHNPIVQDNLDILRKYDFEVITPDTGILACKDIGDGKLPKEAVLIDYILREVAYKKDLAGKKILITAGPTCEAIDPVRYITNHSSGKMGYSLAKCCMLRGADVTLISGPTALSDVLFVKNIPVFSAKDMFDAVTSYSDENDIIIKAAAVADYTPIDYSDEKVKKKDDNLSLSLERTDDILAWLGNHRREGQFLCGFSMETQNLVENSRAKLIRKNVDMMIANNLKVDGAGFSGDTNVVTIITKEGICKLPKLPKDQVASGVIDAILSKLP
ncbi:MAG: bifunctional phosphopantothenoylcysteine decarboxylase/phosphopantothenate--cysteine ligase CoaBC [Eubacterium sp.]